MSNQLWIFQLILPSGSVFISENLIGLYYPLHQRQLKNVAYLLSYQTQAYFLQLGICPLLRRPLEYAAAASALDAGYMSAMIQRHAPILLPALSGNYRAGVANQCIILDSNSHHMAQIDTDTYASSVSHFYTHHHVSMNFLHENVKQQQLRGTQVSGSWLGCTSDAGRQQSFPEGLFAFFSAWHQQRLMYVVSNVKK